MAMFSIASSVRNSTTEGLQRHQSDCSRDGRNEALVKSVLREMARTPDDDAEVLNRINLSNIKDIKSNNFSMKDFFALLRDGKLRLRSFQIGNWDHDVDTVDMAEAGFYYLQNSDRVQCVYCEIVLDGWHTEDDPLLEHARHSPRCPFIAGYDVKNIPVRSDPVRGSGRRLPSFDVCGNNPSSQSSDDSELMNSEESDEDEEESAAWGSSSNSSPQSTTWGISSNSSPGSTPWVPSILPIRHGPINESYGTLDSRLKSFDSPQWPRNCPKSPHELACAGFFYCGPFMSQQDSVKCFYCDTGLCQWEPTDDPWKEHQRVSPNCEYVLLNYPWKKNTQEVAEEWLTSSLVQEFLKSFKCSKNVVRNVLSQKWLKSGRPFETIEELQKSIASDDPLSKILKDNNEKNVKQEMGGGYDEPSNHVNGYGCSQLSSSQGSQQSATSSGYESGSSQSYSWAGSDSDEGFTRGRLTCKVCWDAEIGCIIRPCNHVATCTKCGPALKKCPICRERITLVEKVFF